MQATPLLLISVLLASRVFAALSEDPSVSLTYFKGALYLVVETNYGNKTNSLVYVGTGSVTVIGASWTPDTARLIATKIKQITRLPVTAVIDTSPDPEWAGGNAYWKGIGAQIVALKATDDQLKQRWDKTVEMARANHPEYPKLPLVLPTVIASDNLELEGGAIRLLFLGPSHTPGDIFVYFPNEQVLDAGSILKEQLGNMAKADVVEYPKTLQKLKAENLGYTTIISGHWSPIHGSELVDQYLGFLDLYRRGQPK